MPRRVITFYSFKGGVGRTFALVDVAIFLARSGRKVLCVDWDLEAPGILSYLQRYLPEAERAMPMGPGLLEHVEGLRDLGEAAPPPIRRLPIEGVADRLGLVTAGEPTDDYPVRLQKIDWMGLQDKGLVDHLEALREAWLADWDVVLIDSRTGLSDMGALCTILMPDILVVLFSPNEQSYQGARDVINRVLKRHPYLPLDRLPMRVVPVLARLENNEYKDKLRWQKRVIEEMGVFVQRWRPGASADGAYLEKLMVPHVPYFAYDERLAAIEDESSFGGTIGQVHRELAALLERDLHPQEEVVEEAPLSAAPSGEGGYILVLPPSELGFQLAEHLKGLGLDARIPWAPPIEKKPGMKVSRFQEMVAEREAGLLTTAGLMLDKARGCVVLIESDVDLASPLVRLTSNNSQVDLFPIVNKSIEPALLTEGGVAGYLPLIDRFQYLFQDRRGTRQIKREVSNPILDWAYSLGLTVSPPSAGKAPFSDDDIPW